MKRRPFKPFDQFIEDVCKGEIDLSADSLYVLLTNASPAAKDGRIDTTTPTCSVGAASNCVEIPAGNGYTKKGAAVSVIAAAQSAGIFTLSAADLVFAAAGGEMDPFRYFVLFDDTAGTPSARPGIGWWDWGRAITLKDGSTFTLELPDFLRVAFLGSEPVLEPRRLDS